MNKQKRNKNIVDKNYHTKIFMLKNTEELSIEVEKFIDEINQFNSESYRKTKPLTEKQKEEINKTDNSPAFYNTKPYREIVNISNSSYIQDGMILNNVIILYKEIFYETSDFAYVNTL